MTINPAPNKLHVERMCWTKRWKRTNAEERTYSEEDDDTNDTTMIIIIIITMTMLWWIVETKKDKMLVYIQEEEHLNIYFPHIEFRKSYDFAK